MPEYLAPGVSFRSKSIEGVPTSTTGFTGMTRYGPVHYPVPANHGPLPIEPRMMTSFTEFERMFGGLEALRTPTDGDERVAYTSQAARAFFLNGGQRLYISRVFAPRGAAGAEDWGIASRSIPVSGTTATWRARWPGAYGNVLVETKVVRSKNIAFFSTQYGAVQVTRAKRGAIVEITPAGGTPPKANDPLVLGALAEIDIDLADGRGAVRGRSRQRRPTTSSSSSCASKSPRIHWSASTSTTSWAPRLPSGVTSARSSSLKTRRTKLPSCGSTGSRRPRWETMSQPT